MITYYYKSLRSEKMQELAEPKRGCWVYAEAPTTSEVAELIKRYNLEPGFLEDALDTEEVPRLDREGDQTYMFVRFAYRDSEGQPATAPLLCIAAGDVLISVSPTALPFLNSFMNGKVEFATTQRTKLLLQILQHVSDNFDGFINRTSKQIKTIRARLRGHDISNQDFVDFVLIEDELNEFLASLVPTNAALRRLLLGRHIKLFEEDQDIVEDVLLSNEQSVEGCNSNIKSISNIRDAYSSISSNNLNRTMKVLTIATVAIALPNLFYSMYGMNVDLPGQHRPGAYWAVLGLSIATTWLVFSIARRKRII